MYKQNKFFCSFLVPVKRRRSKATIKLPERARIKVTEGITVRHVELLHESKWAPRGGGVSACGVRVKGCWRVTHVCEKEIRWGSGSLCWTVFLPQFNLFPKVPLWALDSPLRSTLQQNLPFCFLPFWIFDIFHQISIFSLLDPFLLIFTILLRL